MSAGRHEGRLAVITGAAGGMSEAAAELRAKLGDPQIAVHNAAFQLQSPFDALSAEQW